MYIYKVTNLINTVYIGQTKRSAEECARDTYTLTKSKYGYHFEAVNE